MKNQRALVERMDVTDSAPAALSPARGYACAEMVLVGLLALCVLCFVLALNAALPPGW